MVGAAIKGADIGDRATGRLWGWWQRRRGLVPGVTYWLGRPPPLEKQFVGRKYDLKEIKRAFKKSRAVVLAGGPGSGKSRLAVEHTYRSKGRGCWTPAGADVQQMLLALAPSFDIPTQGLSEADIAAAVRRRLADLPEKTLWAVDNLPSLDQFTALQQAAGPIRLLVMTRDSREPLLPATATLKRVGVLKPAAAVSLLCSRGGDALDQKSLEAIADEVGYLPYALAMLAIRLGEELRSPESVLAELRETPNPAQFDVFLSAEGVDMARPDGVFQAISGALAALPEETRSQLAPFGYTADAPIPRALAEALTGLRAGEFPAFVQNCARQTTIDVLDGSIEIHGLTTATIAATNADSALEEAVVHANGRLAGIFKNDPEALRAEIVHHERIYRHAVMVATANG